MNQTNKHLLIIDDDETELITLTRSLSNEFIKISSLSKSDQALETIKKMMPDLILCDLMMPKIDGLQLCNLVKNDPDLKNIRFIIHSAKNYESDRDRAFELGADAYIIKATGSEELLTQIKQTLGDLIELTFWGTRGTLPCSGPDKLRYGGNTSCISLRFPKGQGIVFDCGTGLKTFSDHITRKIDTDITLNIFISHPHWDHVNAIPFFAPLYIPGGIFHIYGAPQGKYSIEDVIKKQMETVFFPISSRKFAAMLHFHNIGEQEVTIDDIIISSINLNHPGTCLGYRVDFNGKSICYITDQELHEETHPSYSEHYFNRLVNFAKDTDILITDCTYNDEMYKTKVGWGHSSVSQTVKFAHAAHAKQLYLFHHDNDETDAMIDKKLADAQQKLNELNSNVRCFAAHDREKILL